MNVSEEVFTNATFNEYHKNAFKLTAHAFKNPGLATTANVAILAWEKLIAQEECNSKLREIWDGIKEPLTRLCNEPETDLEEFLATIFLVQREFDKQL